jgi:hypothetical protein
MKKRGSFNYIPWIFALIFAAGMGFVAFLQYDLQQEHQILETEYSNFRASSTDRLNECSAALQTSASQRQSLQSELSTLQSTYSSLQSEHTSLSDQYTELDAEKEELDEEFSDLRHEVDETIGKIREYERDIQSSIDWFSYNAELDHSNAKTYLNLDCLMEEDNGCYIKTGCFWLVNQEKLDIHYQYDVLATGEADKLFSLQEFTDNDGGDCEDYALFYKAEWNFLLDRCSNDNIIINAWTKGDELDSYWVDWDKDWYLPKQKEHEIRGNYKYPNVVCGMIYDLNEGTVTGHCIVALSKEPIEVIADLPNLDDAVLIEPQNGAYMGRVNDNPGLPIIQQGQSTALYSSYIYMVITDTDYFSYSETDKEWQSYSSFLSQLSDHRQDLQTRFRESLILG